MSGDGAVFRSVDDLVVMGLIWLQHWTGVHEGSRGYREVRGGGGKGRKCRYSGGGRRVAAKWGVGADETETGASKDK